MYHPTLDQWYEILRRAHKHLRKSPIIHSALPSSPRVAFRNPKATKDKLVRSKLKELIKMLASTFVVILTVIYVKYLRVEISLKVRVARKKYRINSPFVCNSCCVVYLLTH